VLRAGDAAEEVIMAVRVIAGQAHGRRLRVPSGGTRPTSGLVRGALFNMLEHRHLLGGAALLDLFAGSGALGIEALSRGAHSVVFVETSDRAVRTIRGNLTASGFQRITEVLTTDVMRAVRILGRRGTRFDGVLVDPPFGHGFVARTLDAIAAADIVVPGGWIALEHRRDEPVIVPPGFELVVTRRHGAAMLSLLQRLAPSSEEVSS
jgi:16S rRNA (guanine966-N2)-methyltransferase